MTWLLIALDVPDRMGGLMTRLHFTPSKRTPGNWWMRFNPKAKGAKDLARHVIGELERARIRRIWRESNDEALQPQKLAKRAARELAKQGRKNRRRRGAGTKIIALQVSQENRLAQDALKRARERRKQADQLAERQVNEHLREVLKRAKGE